MIIEVVPLIKLPRRFSVFDYQAPNDVCVGDVVRASFRRRPIFAVVTATKTASTEKRLLAIEHVASRAVLNQEDITRLFTVARANVQSPSAIFTQAVLLAAAAPIPFVTPRRRISIDPARLPAIQFATNALKNGSQTFQLSLDESFLFTLAVAKHEKRQVLILVPRERDVAVVAESLPLGANTAVWHGHIPKRKRAELALAWRKGTIKTLIATRQASLLPAKHLGAVIVLEAGNDEHRNERRNPRYDARHAVKLLAAQHGAKLAMIDVLPRPEDVVNQSATWNAWERPELIDLTQRAEHGQIPLVSSTLEEKIKTALQSQKKVLLFMNRKGVAKRLQCGACGHIPFCGTCGNYPTVRVDDLVCERCGAEMWLPKACPACGSPKIGMRGLGGARLEHDLTKVFPEATVARVEKGHPVTQADILLVTEYFFSSVHEPFTKRFGLVADIMADMGFVSSDFRSAENVARKIARLMALAADQQAPCVIQTFARVAVDPLLSPKAFILEECRERERYNLPPFSTIAHLREGETQHQVRIKPDDRTTELSKLNELPDSTIISLDNPV
ncbi:MAG: Primosomal protein [Candidatus Uhrbacteria bacterium GW2011_GWD2_52_7]|uniref:Primosomal protein n=1 Tax=Candidatus Uhrbacteria bacterium GW2011_GWD2_52_7 TaxID=1618989 RepID=A0A0G1XFK4_9BACT|nr:MAG: Primosomal protein [Candidatus Uhrbacteria bacterium GW2011_GWD2_52_7]